MQKGKGTKSSKGWSKNSQPGQRSLKSQSERIFRQRRMQGIDLTKIFPKKISKAKKSLMHFHPINIDCKNHILKREYAFEFQIF